MSDLVERLQAALADRYLIERELGRGGMAIVYLAEDRKHQRRVALKVLRPELAASIGAERFLREITTAAQLTHPNILPLHDSGEADGTLYYTMPYIEGESLRDRLSREKQLPIDDALQITREVADALGYAHEQGIVHRDIKPENILFQRGHALVADFGIARAVSAAGAETLTETGLAVGTPAYMSPEQGAGAAELDGRSDLYSLGCVLYEMLSGETPYTGPTPQAILAKKLTEPLPRITAVRAAVPASVEAAITKALARTPADRYGTAAQLVAALRSGNGPDTTAAPVRRRRWRPWAATTVVLVIVVGGAVGWEWYVQTGGGGTLLGEGVLSEQDRMLVARLTNRTDDSTLGPAITDAIEVALGESRAVRVLSASQKQDGMRRMGFASAADFPDSLWPILARRENAKAYVTGHVSRLGSGYQITARVVATASGEEVLTRLATARDAESLIEAMGELGASLRRGIGESLRNVRASPDLARVTTPSLQALVAYTAGLRASGESRDRSIALLKEAVRLDTTFAMAWRAIAVLGPVSEDEHVYASDRAYALRDHLPDRERLLVEAAYHAARGNETLAEMAYRQLIELDPDEYRALNNLSTQLSVERRWEEAEPLALRAVELDPLPHHVGTALEALVPQRRFDRADSVLRVGERHSPGHPSLLRFRGDLLFARRDFEGAERYWDSLSHAPSTLAERFVRRRWCQIALVRGRIGESRTRCGASFPIVRAFLELRYTGDTAAAAAILEPVLRRSDASASPPAWQLELLVITLAEMGRVDLAQRYLGAWMRESGADRPTGRLAGEIALAEGLPDGAVSAFRAWSAEPRYVYNTGLPELADAYEQAGRVDSAIVFYERALETPSIYGVEEEMDWYPVVLRRLGELHESLGHRQQAIDYYGRFIDLWKDADPELQPQVEEARAALARLTGEPS